MLKESFWQLEKLKTKWKLNKTCKAIYPVGIEDWKWLFKNKEIQKYIASFESYKQTYTLAFLVGLI